jgi:hypothetical protein
MPYIIEKLPDPYLKKIKITFGSLLAVLPEKIPYEGHVWIGGRLARDGAQILSGKDVITEGLIFLIDSDDDPLPETMQYFDGLVASLGIHATVSKEWRNQSREAILLYANGEKLLDAQGCYKRPPPAIAKEQIITKEFVYRRLPQTVPFLRTLWWTGSFAKFGESFHDLDIFIDDTGHWNDRVPITEIIKMKHYFTKLLGCRVDVGCIMMLEREPIAMCKLYENGCLCPLP